MKRLTERYIGTELSHATLRNEDLIPSFMGFLHGVKEVCEIKKEVDAIQKDIDTDLELEENTGYGSYYKDQEAASYILNEDIWNLLDNIAPDFTYFGSSEGDGASFGFWTSEEALKEYVKDELIWIAEQEDDLEQISQMTRELCVLMDAHDY